MSSFALGVLVGQLLLAQTTPPQPTGAPPPEAKALVVAPKAVSGIPAKDKIVNTKTLSVASGGQLATGNSRLAAVTANAAYDVRRDANGFGASVLGNYGKSGSPGQSLQVTAENLQARTRYDRFLIDRASLFGIATARHGGIHAGHSRI